MRLTLAEPKYLKDSISIISDLVTEANFKITKETIELVAMDPANVAMVVFKLFSSIFTEYDIAEATSIGINLSNLKQILRRIKSDDLLTLEVDNNKLKITLKGSSTRTFYLPIIEIEEKEQKVPQLEFLANVETNSGILLDAIEDVDIVGESVIFNIEDNMLKIQAEGDLSRANIDIPSSDKTKIDAKDKVKAKYSIEYLKKMMNASKLSDNVSLMFSNDYPLKLEYKELNKISISFILAPRVEND